jgi:hypothetical protein
MLLNLVISFAYYDKEKLIKCNTLKFAFLQMELNCFIYDFLRTFKPRENDIFIEIKIHHKPRNMFMHSCWCI